MGNLQLYDGKSADKPTIIGVTGGIGVGTPGRGAPARSQSRLIPADGAC